MMAVAVNLSGAEPTFGKPAALFADEYDFGQAISIPNYERDARRAIHYVAARFSWK
jgi:hypothetical protein